MNLYLTTKHEKYYNMSKEIANWLINVSKLRRENGLFMDGISPSSDCADDNRDFWTYNQGIFLDSFVDLSHFSNDNMTYVDIAI
jgi:predicted alpha-1,6-mannanase (GH76 family)